MKNHNFFSNLAFCLAENHLGKTSKNPSVGCVVVKNNSIISSGVTSIKGRPHAEYNALNKNMNFKGSIMYVTLEPCTHYGITPPCTNLIKRKKIKRVFYCFDDPDLRTYKKAKKKYKNKIIKLKNIESRNKKFYKSYYLNKKENFPLIDAKLAISKDYYTINKNSQWITNNRSRKVGHLLRSKYDCIISTSSSINKDNSLLNCRINGLNNSKPDLIIIDRYLKLKKRLNLFNISNKRKTFVVTLSNDRKKISFLQKRKIKVIKINQLKNKTDFKILFRKIFLKVGGRVLIETGLTFLNELFRFNLVNDLYIFLSSTKLKNKGYNNNKINYIKKIKLKNMVNVNLNNDKLFRIEIK